MSEPGYDAIVIGGGHNGLVAAHYLAADGLSVLVLERLERIGGGIGTEELYPGFHVPYCAYICHMLHGKIIDDLELRRHGFDLYPVEPWSFHPFPDGTHLLGWQDTRKFTRELRKLSERDAEMYPDWVSFWDRACGIVYRYFLTDPPTFAQVAADVRGTADEEVWETMLTVPMRDLIERFFEDERVRAYFVNAQDAGDPSAPGSVLSVAYIRSGVLGKPENRGIPKGGMGRVSEAMARAARARGVEIRTGVTVDRVLVEDGRARGVRLADGRELRAPLVISNADPKRTYLSLVDSKHLDEAFLHRVRHLTTRANCVKALVALRSFPDFSRWLGPGFDPRLAAYTKICPSVEWFQASCDAARLGRLSRTPIMYIQFPSAYDPTLAPRGMHVMSSWSLYYPAHPADGPWDTAKKKALAELHVEILSQYAPNFRESVLDITVETPLDIESRIGMTDGNIRHLDVTAQQFFARRMPYRSPIPGLYLCGGGTHPGGELTGAPGHNCAKAILRDLEETVVRR
ncbi:MAG TPA: NAD(P)/FAD-dependent oxidoreductase [Methylomirabilota bacterium]|jgi:phytoene dehydrogenase-like protein|nr:NAD(P)/FAD-dependent oxidoreductase [Methylomirabilota bacterium]